MITTFFYTETSRSDIDKACIISMGAENIIDIVYTNVTF